jgi:hypothetical protein
VETKQSIGNPHPTIQPAFYASTISSYAERSQDEYLSCGLNYRAFARFIEDLQSIGAPTTLGISGQPHVYAVVHNLQPDGEEILQFDTENGYESLSVLQLPAPQTSRLIFVRGYLLPRWIRLIGSQYRLDPEFFRRNLDFLQQRDFCDLPSLPSTSKNIVRLRITNIWTRTVPLSIKEIAQERIGSKRILEEYQNALVASGRAGDSIIRNYSVHSETLYTIEQDIFFSVKKRNKGWTGNIPVVFGVLN